MVCIDLSEVSPGQARGVICKLPKFQNDYDILKFQNDYDILKIILFAKCVLFLEFIHF